MHTHTKTLIGYLSVAILVTCILTDGAGVFLIQHAAAQGATVTPTSSVFQKTASLAVGLATAMETLAFLIFHFLQFLLDPLFILDLTTSAALNRLWQYSRDIMNIIFAFMLILAGVYTVVTGKKELVQERFKKFILAVVLVNFSWFFPRVILDIANVLTATIYQLPAGLNGGVIDCRLPPKRDGEPPQPCRIITDIKYFSGCDSVPSTYTTKMGIVCYREEAWQSDTNTAFGMLNGLVANYGRLGDLARVLNPERAPDASPDSAERFKQFMVFLMHIIFVLVLMAMLFLPLAAMFVVFLIRIPIMWVTIAFMPFMFLGFVMGDKMKNFDTMAIFKKYVTAAFLPTAIAVPFAAGFLILTEVTQIPCPEVAGSLCADTGPLLHNINTMWGLLMLMIAFIIIWFGFWAAISIDPIYEKATAGIKSFGESVGKTAIKLPLSAPILPIGDGTSILGVDDAVRRINASLSAGKGPLESLGAGLTDSGGPAGASDKAATGKELAQALSNPTGTIPNLLKSINESLRSGLKNSDADGNGKLNNAELLDYLRNNGGATDIIDKLNLQGVKTDGLDADKIATILDAQKSKIDVLE